MSERNLGVVNNVLGIEANGNPGDVITRDAGLGVGWAPPGGGIAGIAAQNAGVPVAGGPWQTLDAITGTLVDGGGGVLQYTPPPGGTGMPYPDAAPAAPNANNDEFTAALPGAWTVAVALAGGNVADANVNANSRVVAHIVANVTDTLLLSKVLSGAWVGDISVTVSCALGKYIGSFVGIDFGFLDVTANAGLLARIDASTGDLLFLNFSNWSANTNAALITATNVFDVTKSLPPKGYYHLQRVGGTWSIWVSTDGAAWVQLGTDATALAVVGSGLGIRGFGSVAPYSASVDWIRYNWLLLP